MRIILACIRYPPAPGGAEAHVAALAEGLLKRGHEVEVFTTDLKTEVPFVREPGLPSVVNGVPVRRFPAMTLGGEAHYVFADGIGTALLREGRRADIIHAHSYGYVHTLLAPFAARLAGVPFILTPHFHPFWSMEGGGKRAILRHTFDWTLGRLDVQLADRVIAVTGEELRLMESQLRLHKIRATVIPNGINIEPFRRADGKAFRQAFQLGDGPLVLFAGRLASNKGLRRLVRAMGFVRRDVPDAKLVLVGEDQGLLPDLEAIAKASHVEMVSTGHLPDAMYANAIAASTVFVLPSDYEAFGIVLLEAMACGRPIVAARVGGVPDVVTHGVEGLLVQPSDEAALAGALSALLSDETRREAMGKAGRAKAEAYTWDAILPRVLDVYHETKALRA
ncbi:MAG: glycosyltransferase family 4 protein [Thermoplasmatota archaeon]